jgi:hypothetical protein
MVFSSFFKWLYNRDEPDNRKRITPPCMRGIKRLPRQEKPSDLWSTEEHGVFLKYCPSKRDVCYHSMANDTSARPSELLNLRISDIVFKVSESGIQYAEILVSGKTKSRTLPLISSIPYLKDWLQNHPAGSNASSWLFVGGVDARTEDAKRLRFSRAKLKRLHTNYSSIDEIKEEPGDVGKEEETPTNDLHDLHDPVTDDTTHSEASKAAENGNNSDLGQENIQESGRNIGDITTQTYVKEPEHSPNRSVGSSWSVKGFKSLSRRSIQWLHLLEKPRLSEPRSQTLTPLLSCRCCLGRDTTGLAWHRPTLRWLKSQFE